MDNRRPIQDVENPGCFKEAVCINAERIYDSCSEGHQAGTNPLLKTKRLFLAWIPIGKR